MQGYRPRYRGTRWSIVYGSYEGIEQFALQELHRAVQRYQPYVIQLSSALDRAPRDAGHLLLVGTPENSPLIKELIQSGHLSLPGRPQAYTIACMDSPWHPGCRLVIIAGSDPSGVLYGVEDLNAHVLSTEVTPEKPTPSRLREAFDSMADFTISEYPHIERRGIWTWGYVIYDYRRFLDNMARLKMNTLIIWNDCPPVNCPEITAYAHLRGIQVILGFPWGWGLEGMDLFGLHATSIRDRYADLEPLDPRVTIVWEDAGTLPYTYTPVTELPNSGQEWATFDTFERTLEYSRRIAVLREGCPFAMVPKGWTNLDWQSEFEHHGPFLLGERDPGFIRERWRQRQPRWDRVNRLWLQYYPLAARFYREVLACVPAGMSVTGLVEDGIFEERIQLAVALFAETIWNPNRPDDDLLQRATSPYYGAQR